MFKIFFVFTSFVFMSFFLFVIFSCSIPTNEKINYIIEIDESDDNDFTLPAYSGSEGLIYSFINNNEELSVGLGTATGRIIIPPTVFGLPVTTIQDESFQESAITEISIPDSITSIEENDFCACEYLESVTLGNNISIKNNAFDECDSLKYISMGDNNSIGDSAFEQCYYLFNITIPDSDTSIGDRAFYKCLALDSVTMKSEIPPSLGIQAFYDDTDTILTDLKIYVPAGCVETYQDAENKYTNWSTYASCIREVE